MKTTWTNIAMAVVTGWALATAAAAGDPPTTRAAAAMPDYDAQCVKVEVPKKVLTDEVFKSVIVMKNMGSQTWGPGSPETYSVLRSQAPPGNTTWGTNFIIQHQGTNVKPGDEFEFATYVKAPHTAGQFVFQWRLAKKAQDRALFGEMTPRAVIEVEARPATPPPAPPPADSWGKHVLGFADFEYLGSFRVPDRVEGATAGWSNSGLALRKGKDGTKRLLMNFTHQSQFLFEVDIPGLVKLKGGDRDALEVARVSKVWGAIAIAVGDVPGLKSIGPNGGFWWDEGQRTLYWTWCHHYWAGPLPPVLGASKLADDGQITSSGPWRIPQPQAKHFKAYWGGVTKLSSDFAARATGGRTLALGFGGGYSICAPCSYGPSLGAIAAPDPAKGEVDMVELLAYGKDATAPRDGDYFNAPGGYLGRQPDDPDRGYWMAVDRVHSSVFIDLPGQHAYIAFGCLRTGRVGYDYGAVPSTGEAQWWYFYDPKDLAEAAQGARKPGEVLPHSRAKVTLPGNNRGTVTGSCFDEAEKLLYLYKPMCLDTMACVHVYRLKR